MIDKRRLHLPVSLLLIFSLLTISLPQTGFAQSKTAAKTSSDLPTRLARIEARLEKRRAELGIPGLSLAIVKDGKVILSKGYGYKNFEKKAPVTSRTQFAIGSATKAFTALSVLISQDQGKLTLDESPKKYLPYFKINEPDIDKNIKIRDLLSHSSGLNRTDLAFLTGKLTREELIRVAGEAKPTAGLHEKFQYQNIMYAAAGEIVAKVQEKRWEDFVIADIFKPLGMTNSNISVSAMQHSIDYSLGYNYNFDTKQTVLVPTREIGSVAPAGSINSSADDMAKWLGFVLSDGQINGRRLVSETGFAEWLKPQMNITPNGKVAYGLGWFLQEWQGKRVVQHGGNIDGFNSMVAMIPEENLGFVLLTNVSGSSLGDEMMGIVWENLLNEMSLSDEAASEVGKYHLAEGNIDIEIKIVDGKLAMSVPGQPTYPLENIEARKYKLIGAPDGFFITFREGEAYLEQPNGKFTLKKLGTSNDKTSTAGSESAKSLIGKYESEQKAGSFIEIKVVDGKASLVVGEQPPYPLVEKEKDLFRSPSLPDSYSIRVTRDPAGNLSGIVLIQPEGEFPFKYIGETEKNAVPDITVDELIAKTITAFGGEENLRKITSRVVKIELDFVHQGVKGFGTIYSAAPNKSSTEITLTAVGKEIGSIVEYFDGSGGGEEYSFSPDETYTGQQLEDIRYTNDFYGFLDWKSKNKSIEIAGTEKIGDEEAYVIRIQPLKASAQTYYISTRTFLPIKARGIVVSSTSSVRIPVSTTFEDYREIDGVMIPFKTVSSNSMNGDTVAYVKEVKQNVPIKEEKFGPRKK